MDNYAPSPFNWIDRLPEKERSLVEQNLSPLVARRGGDVYTPMTEARGIYRVISGSADMYVLNPGGRQLLLKRFEPGETFGEVATLDLQRYPVFVTMDPQSSMGFMSFSKTASLMREYPLVDKAIQSAVCYYVRTSLTFLASSTTGSSIDRVRDRLDWLLKNQPSSAGTSAIKITQSQLASMVGLTRQSTNEVLAYLSLQQEVRIERGQIFVRAKK